MSEQLVLAVVALAIPAIALLIVLTTARRGPFQFSLRMALLWIIPFAAVIAWVSSWEGPFWSPRRVVTHKTGMLLLVMNAGLSIAMWHRGWFRGWTLIAVLMMLAMLFGWLAWNMHLERQREATPANHAIPISNAAWPAIVGAAPAVARSFCDG